MSITVDIPYRTDVEVELWCHDNFTEDDRFRVRSTFDCQRTIQTFIFENETDAMAFKLRWT